jgi:hypothetical protein
MKVIMDFSTNADLEMPIHYLKNGATTQHILAKQTDTNSNLQEALFYLADDARELQDWFDVATMATKPDKD